DDWLSCQQPRQEMLDLLRQRGWGSSRKLRLFAAACARRLWPMLAHETHAQVVELAERVADGEATFKQLRGARAQAIRRPDVWETEYDQEEICPGRAVFALAEKSPHDAAYEAAYHSRNVSRRIRCDLLDDDLFEKVAEAKLLNEVFGNPFRSVTIDPLWLAWQDGTAAKMARAIYDGRDFGRTPILADALEDAGCADDVLLSHLRSAGPHVRGCWVIDLILGKQ